MPRGRHRNRRAPVSAGWLLSEIAAARLDPTPAASIGAPVLTTWTSRELAEISAAGELQIAATTVRVVRVGEELYARAADGPDEAWHRDARELGLGRVGVGGRAREVEFADVDPDPELGERIDAAYRAKYGHRAAHVVEAVTGPQARAATVRLLPREVAAAQDEERPGTSGTASKTASEQAEDRVSTFELFFDLVYVFALTQITQHMARTHSGVGVTRGVLLLALAWFSWSAYAWLGNQARADLGIVRAGMAFAMAGVFVMALCVPEAWNDAAGGLYAPVVLGAAYLFVRCVHLIVSRLIAHGDRAQLRQIKFSWPTVLCGGGLLIAGAAIGGAAQTEMTAAAILVDWGGFFLTSRWGDLRIHSAAYFTERHNLFVIIAIGESLLAMGAATIGQNFDTPLLIAALLGIGTALGLWWLYFDLITLAVEERLHHADRTTRLKLAVDAFGYAHFPIVAGIVLTALGVEGVVGHAADTKGLGAFYAWALAGGAALYVAGLVLFGWLTLRAWGAIRLVAVCLLLIWTVPATMLPPLAASAGVAVVLGALAVFETHRYAGLRNAIRTP
jgi:low temperature requirement protein LtrA